MALDPKNVKPGEEQYESFYSSIVKKRLIQYDYRHNDGELFSCVAPTLDKAVEWRDIWLTKKYEEELNRDATENEDEQDFEP